MNLGWGLEVFRMPLVLFSRVWVKPYSHSLFTLAGRILLKVGKHIFNHSWLPSPLRFFFERRNANAECDILLSEFKAREDFWIISLLYDEFLFIFSLCYLFEALLSSFVNSPGQKIQYGAFILTSETFRKAKMHLKRQKESMNYLHCVFVSTWFYLITKVTLILWYFRYMAFAISTSSVNYAYR